MTLYGIIKNNINKKWLDYTFLYNPDFDYKPTTNGKLLEKAWSMVGKNMQKAITSFSVNPEVK